MARKDLTVVSQSKFLATAEKLGMIVKVNKGETKIWPAGGTIKQSIGVPNTKGVTRIQLVGFENAEYGIPHPKPPSKTVTQILNFNQDEKLILRAFYHVAKDLIHAVQVAKELVAETTITSTPAEAPDVVETVEVVEEPAEVAVG